MIETLKINILDNVVEYFTYSRWLSLCILRVTNEEIKLKFRQLEKYKLKSLKAKSHLFFNETYIYIYS